MKATIYKSKLGERSVLIVAELQTCLDLSTHRDFVLGLCESMKWAIVQDDLQPEQWFTMLKNKRWVKQDSAFDAASVVTEEPGSRLKLFVDGLGEIFCDFEYPAAGASRSLGAEAK